MKDEKLTVMKKIVLFALGMAMSMTTFAQDEVETTISADVVSSYIWRGQELGSVALQPTLGVGYKGLSLTAWGSTGLTNPADTKEFDFTLAYTLGGFNIGVTDYWFSAMPAGGDPDGRYFKYDAHATNHVFEGNIGYDFGFASFQWYTNFAGNDYKEDGKRAYSSYMEVVVPFKLSAIEWTATAGAVPSAGGCKPLFTESLLGSWLHAAAVILPGRWSPLLLFSAGKRGFFLYTYCIT